MPVDYVLHAKFGLDPHDQPDEFPRLVDLPQFHERSRGDLRFAV